MDDRKIYIREYDRARLQEMILQAMRQRYQGRRELRELQALLDMAEIVPDEQLPEDISMMGSRVRVRDLDTQRERTYTLVWPDETDLDESKVSVLAPLGAALLGREAGAEFDWMVPEGNRHLKILEVQSQPEGQGSPNDVADAVNDMTPLPYPERRRPLDEELSASDDTPTEVQSKWEGGFPSPHNAEEFEERSERDNISAEEIEEGAEEREGEDDDVSK